MLRSSLFIATALFAAPALAQTTPAATARSPECLVRITATPASWLIQGFDPFDNRSPEGSFNVTFFNEGGSECRITPVFELPQPPFGLKKNGGTAVRYALLNLSDSRDVTPYAARSLRKFSDPELVLAPNQSKMLTYKLVVDPSQVREAGMFTQDVTIDAQDRSFVSFGSTDLVLGIQVLPSARMGLSGAYSMNKGQAVVDLGELRTGIAPVVLGLYVNSTGSYDLQVSSSNLGKLRLGSTEWTVPYAISIGGDAINLSGVSSLSKPAGAAPLLDPLDIQFVIGDVSDRRAGTYSDVISISVTAR